jgi:hypothetical protein
MQYMLKDFTLDLIDEPLQSHVVAWERAARALRNDEAKPVINGIMNELRKINVAHTDTAQLLGIFQMIFKAMDTALKIINDNETVTMSSHRGVMVKAAMEAGWILSFSHSSGTNPLIVPDDVDKLPPWLVQWIAEKVAEVYNDATTIPKN